METKRTGYIRTGLDTTERAHMRELARREGLTTMAYIDRALRGAIKRSECTCSRTTS